MSPSAFSDTPTYSIVPPASPKGQPYPLWSTPKKTPSSIHFSQSLACNPTSNYPRQISTHAHAHKPQAWMVSHPKSRRYAIYLQSSLCALWQRQVCAVCDSWWGKAFVQHMRTELQCRACVGGWCGWKQDQGGQGYICHGFQQAGGDGARHPW